MAPTPRSRTALRALAVLVAAGWCAYALHVVLSVGTGPLFDSWVYNGLIAAAGGACLLRAALVPAERAAWALFGVGLLLWTAGEVYWTLAFTGLDEVPIPSPADLLYLALYPALFAALVKLARDRLGRFGRRLTLDGAITALAAAGLAAGVSFGPIFEAAEGGPLAVVTNLAYPLSDLVLLALVVGVITLTGRRPGRAWLVLAAGLVLMALADGVYVVQSANGTYSEGGLLDLLWPTAALLIAVAAWQRPERDHRRGDEQRVTFAPVACALVAVAAAVLASIVELNLLAQLLSAAALMAVAARMALAFVDNQDLVAQARRDATQDSLTRLGNRRLLMRHLDRAIAEATPEDPRVLALFDLNGFKRYNDVYGHPAGDQLLARLGQRVGTAVAPHCRAYRLGGDEFCVLGRPGPAGTGPLVKGAASALSERGEGFMVDAAHGAVLLPAEAGDATAALQLADTRMYSDKRGGRASAHSQTCNALLAAQAARHPALERHINQMAPLAKAVASSLGMTAEQRDEVERAVEMHDLGKVAVPDAILSKPGPFDEAEWEFMRRHTLIGQRILSAAPALAPVGLLVRSTHEHFDGMGYPDGLVGEDIPLGARVVAVCDAFDAMTSARPYRDPLSPEDAAKELKRCAGSQFDPQVVEEFIAALAAASPTAAPVATRG